MKILYHHRIRSKDGQFVHIEELVAALRRRGHEVIVVGPAAVAREAFGAEAGPVDRLKRFLPAAAYESLELLYGAAAYRRLARAHREHRPDALYERYSLHLPAGVWLKRRTGLPMLLEVNAPLADERARHGGLALRRLARRSERSVWRGADRVLSVTGVLAEHVRAAGVAEDRIAVIPNGIDPARFADPPDAAEAKRRFGLDGRLVLGFTGFVREWHRLDRVIELLAASGRPDLHLLVIGDGPARPELEALARRLGVPERVTFAGVVPRDRIAAAIAAFDIALQPAVVPYASPLKLFEYMALGRAIVAPRTANIAEVLTDGRDALLVDPGSPGELTAAILRLAEGAGLRARLGAAARRTIDRRGLTWDRNAARVEALFDELLRTRPNARVRG